MCSVKTRTLVAPLFLESSKASFDSRPLHAALVESSQTITTGLQELIVSLSINVIIACNVFQNIHFTSSRETRLSSLETRLLNRGRKVGEEKDGKWEFVI